MGPIGHYIALPTPVWCPCGAPEAGENKNKKHAKEVKLRLDKDKSENDRSTQTKDLKATNKKLDGANKHKEMSNRQFISL